MRKLKPKTTVSGGPKIGPPLGTIGEIKAGDVLKCTKGIKECPEGLIKLSDISDGDSLFKVYFKGGENSKDKDSFPLKSLRNLTEFTRLSSKGQIVIPKEIRKILNLKAGAPLAIETTSTGGLLIKAIPNPIDEEDHIAAEAVEMSFERIAKGKSKKFKGRDFLEELEKW